MLEGPRRHQVSQRTHKARPTTPFSPPTGGSSCLASRGGMLAPAPTPQAARRGGCKRLVEKTLTEGRPIAAVLAGVRLATSLLQRVVVLGGRLVHRPSQQRSSSWELLHGALTPPSNTHTTRQTMSLSYPHLPETAGSASIHRKSFFSLVTTSGENGKGHSENGGFPGSLGQPFGFDTVQIHKKNNS